MVKNYQKQYQGANKLGYKGSYTSYAKKKWVGLETSFHISGVRRWN